MGSRLVGPVRALAVGGLTVALLGILPGSASATAVPDGSADTCSGAQVVDVSAGILHEADGGVAGNVWALDSGTERARVWQQGPGAFCVVITFIGQFTTFAGKSPGATGTVAAGDVGTIVSRQRYVVAADFTPVIPTSGFLGTFDFDCSAQGMCPGNVRFGPLLFSNITGVSGSTFVELAISPNGVWFQTSTSSRGDIVG
jgi:hypothetical protein